MTNPYSSACDSLGCCTDVTVQITGLCGQSSLGILEDVVNVTWNRVLDDISTAQITVLVPSASPDCCDILGELRSWCHEVHIFRCGVRVWSGPIQRIAWFSDRVVIDAKDNLAWLFRTASVPEFEAVNIDLSAIAAGVISANLVADSGAGCLVVDARATGVVLEDYFIDENAGYVGDILNQLVDLGMHYTVVGRRLTLFGVEPLSLLGPLTDEDFLGEIGVVEDGAFAVTRAFVSGNGTDVQMAEVAGVCGRIDGIRADASLEEEADALALARRLVAGGYPTPVFLDIPAGAALAPDSPVCIADLVPGVDVRVYSNATCRELAADLRLSTLEVQSSSDSESVQITLQPANADTGGFDS